MSDVAVVLGVGCFFCSAGLTFLYFSERARKEAAFLTSATRLTLKELGKLFDDDNQRLHPEIVAVSGRVGSSKPMACKISGLKAVLVDLKDELQLERKHYGSWSRDSTLVQLKTEEVPWYLDDGSGQLVYVRGARDAQRFKFPVQKEAWENYPATDPNHNFIKVFGMKRTESLLPIGTSLTVIGEVVKDEGGRVWIQPPLKDQGRFYVFGMTFDELVARLLQEGRMWNDLTAILMVYVGVMGFLGCMTICC